MRVCVAYPPPPLPRPSHFLLIPFRYHPFFPLMPSVGLLPPGVPGRAGLRSKPTRQRRARERRGLHPSHQGRLVHSRHHGIREGTGDAALEGVSRDLVK